MNNDQKLIEAILSIPEETETLEFKRVDWEWTVKKILETMVAMTNTEGGKIIIGIGDPEKSIEKWHNRVFGIEENQDNYDSLMREMQRIIPPIILKDPLLIKNEKNAKTIAILSIEKSTDQLRYINNEVFIRGKKSNKKLSPTEIVKYSYAKGFEKADKELVKVDFELLNTEYYKAWKESRNISYNDIKDVLFHTWLARKNEEWILLPTRAAILLFALYPTNLMDTKCTIRVFQYTWTLEKIGETPNLIGVPKTIEWPTIKLIKDAHEYVLTLLRSGIKIPSWFTTKYLIPERAVKEAITNAVIHRDYYIKRDIEVRIFEDRVEVESPWLFPYNITSQNIGSVRSEWYRNDLIVKHLREFPTPPNLDSNEWVRAMRSEMLSNKLYPPIFLTYPHLQDSVRVVLFNESTPSDWDKVVHYLKSNPFIDNETARGITKTTQLTKMSEKLKSWTKKWLLIRIPEDPNVRKWVKYKLTASSNTASQENLFTLS